MIRHSTSRARTGGRGSRSRSGLRPGPTCSCSPARRRSSRCTRSSTRSLRPNRARGRPTTCCAGPRHPVSALALAAVVYPRLPAGGRAALAAVLGALCLEGVVLAIADARAVGARGEDWTGFLFLPVGIVLLGSPGLVWRSRKPGRLRYLRRAGSPSQPSWRLLARPAGRDRDPRHASPARGRRPADLGGPTRSDDSDERRPRPRGLVRPLAQRRRRHLVSDPPGEAGAGADARPPRLRRAPPRRARLRRKRGRPELFGWDGAKDIDAAVAWLSDGPT